MNLKNRNKVFIIVCLLVQLIGGFTSKAQVYDYNREECVKYALEHSPKIHQSISEDQINAANYSDAIGRFLPKVSANTSAYINYGRGIDPTTNTYTNINSFRNGYSIEANLLIFDGLYSIYNLKHKRFEQLAGKEGLKQIQQEVKMSTIEAYYNLLYTKELKRLATEHLLNSRQQSLQAEKMYELGMKSRQDVSEMKATEASDRLKQVQANNQYEIALLQLKAAMNYPIDQPLNINDSLSYQDVLPTLLEADDIYAMAQNKSPEILLANLKVESLHAAYKSTIGSFLPTLRLFSGYSTSFSFYMDGSKYEPFIEQLRNRRGAYLGITLSFDIFTGLTKTNNLKRAKAQYKAEKYKKDETDIRIYKEIKEVIMNLNASVEEYKAATNQAVHLQEVYEAHIKNYKMGNTGSIELSLAAARAKEAKAEVARKYTMYLLHKEWLAYYAE